MYIIIEHTNGSGYSSPTIHKMYNKKEAEKKFNSLVRAEKKSGNPFEFIDDPVRKKKTFVFEDGEDLNSVSFIELIGEYTVLVINCNYANEMRIKSYNHLQDAVNSFIGERNEIEIDEEGRVTTGNGEDGFYYIEFI